VIVEGWQIAAVAQAQSGSPVNIVTSTSTINGIPNTVRPDLIGQVQTVGRIDQLVRHQRVRRRESVR